MADRPYHHGDLQTALMDAVVQTLTEEGVHAVSLRKAARTVGVSHAAPAHHFGDLHGLLAAVAIRAHRQLGDAMLDAAEALCADAPSSERISAAGLAYMRFGAGNPGVFQIMFRQDLLSMDADLDSPEKRSLQVLLDEVARGLGADSVEDPDVWGLALSLWSIVHGATSILLNGVPDPAGAGSTVESVHEQIGTLIRPALDSHPRWDSHLG